MTIIPCGKQVQLVGFTDRETHKPLTGKVIGHCVTGSQLLYLVKLNAEFQFWSRDSNIFVSIIAVDSSVVVVKGGRNDDEN